MALEEKHVDVPLVIGIDQGTDPQASPNGALLLTNVRYTKEGALVRRPGIEQVAGSSAGGVTLIKAGQSLGSYGLIGGVADTVGITPIGAGSGSIANRLPVVDARTVMTGTAGNSVLSCDMALHSLSGVTYACVVAGVYTEAGPTPGVEVWAWLYNYDSGEMLSINRLETNGFYPRVVTSPISNTFSIFWLRNLTNPGDIRFAALTPLTGAFAPTVTIVAADAQIAAPLGQNSQACSYDTVQFGSLTYVAFVRNSTSRINVVTVDTGGAVTATAAGTVATGIGPVAITRGVNGTSFFNTVYLSSTGAPSYSVFSTAPAHISSAAVATLTVSPGKLTALSDNANLYIVAEQGAARAIECVSYTQAGTGLLTLATNTTCTGLALGTRPFVQAGRLVVGAAPASTGYPAVWYLSLASTVTGAWSRAQPYAVLSIEDAFYPAVALDYLPKHFLPSVVSPGANLQAAVFPAVLESAEAPRALQPYLSAIYRWQMSAVDFDTTSQGVVWTELNGVAYICGSILQSWDGGQATEAALLTAPVAPVVATGAGSILSPGLYAYCIVIEASDTQGNLKVSAPSEPTLYTVTGAADGTPQITVTNNLTTAAAFNAGVRQFRLKLFRTQANGSVFNLVRSFTVSVGSSYIFNEAFSNALIAGEEILYTTSGELPSEPAPPVRHIATHRNRLFAVRGDQSSIAFTKEVTPPFAPQWNVELNIRVDNEGGWPTAVASMDDKLIIFQASQILMTTGDGPDATGGGAPFPVPEKIAVGIGVDAENACSVVSCPLGVLFRHSTGIYLLSRDMQISFIGDLVRDYVDAMTSLRVVRYLPSQRQVWFAGVPNTILVLDTLKSRWSVYQSDAIDNTATYVGGLVERDDVVHILTDSARWQINTAAWRDIGASSTAYDYDEILELPWFRGDGHGGMVRVWEVALSFNVVTPSAQSVTLQTYTRQEDRPAKPSETPDFTYTWADMSTYTVGALTLTARLKRQRCSACKVRVVLNNRTTTTNVEGVRLTNVRFYYGIAADKGKSPHGPVIT